MRNRNERKVTLMSRFTVTADNTITRIGAPLTPAQVLDLLECDEVMAHPLEANLTLVFPVGGRSMTKPRNELASDTYGFPLHGTVLLCPANEYEESTQCAAQTT